MNDMARKISNTTRLLLKKLNFCWMTFDIFQNGSDFYQGSEHRTEVLVKVITHHNLLLSIKLLTQ